MYDGIAEEFRLGAACGCRGRWLYGLEAGRSRCQARLDVTVLEMARAYTRRVWQRRKTAEAIHALHAAHGVRILTETALAEDRGS